MGDLAANASGDLKRSDMLNMLEHCRDFTETGAWVGLFTYPNCGGDLVAAGLTDTEGKITEAGRTALFLADRELSDSAPTSEGREND